MTGSTEVSFGIMTAPSQVDYRQRRPGLLTVAEVAAMTGATPDVVRRWVRAGKVDAIRTPGGQHWISRASLGAFIVGRGIVGPGRRPTSPR